MSQITRPDWPTARSFWPRRFERDDGAGRNVGQDGEIVCPLEPRVSQLPGAALHNSKKIVSEITIEPAIDKLAQHGNARVGSQERFRVPAAQMGNSFLDPGALLHGAQLDSQTIGKAPAIRSA